MIKTNGTITIKFEKNEVGLCSIQHDLNTSGMAIFELVGLLDIVKHQLIKNSVDRATELAKFPANENEVS